MCIEAFIKEELAWAIDKQLQVVNYNYNTSYTTKNIKNEDILNLKQYYMHCYVAFTMQYKTLTFKNFDKFGE